MWELLIRVVIGLSGWVFAGWIMYCRNKSNQKIIAGLKEVEMSLDRTSAETQKGLDECRAAKDMFPSMRFPPSRLQADWQSHIRCEVEVPAGALLYADTKVYEAVYKGKAPGVIRRTENGLELLLDDTAGKDE